MHAGASSFQFVIFGAVSGAAFFGTSFFGATFFGASFFGAPSS